MDDVQSRRRVLSNCLIGLIGAIAVATPSEASTNQAAAESLRNFDLLLSQLQAQPNLVDEMRGYHEPVLGLPHLIPQHVPIDLPPSKTKISLRATNLIVFCEVTSSNQYTARYQRPTWPGGQSGVTIGIGYDLGAADKAQLLKDWNALPIWESALLARCCGKKAESAAALIKEVAEVSIPYQDAYQQFLEQEQPQFIALTETVLPHFKDLSEDSRGALVSLTYNRGPSFGVPASKDPAGRYKEMRNIYTLMQTQEYSKIPVQIRCMKRIWKDDPLLQGIVARRELEATLFESGLVK